MVSQKEMQKINRMVKVIKEEGTIHKWDLIDKARVSIRDYSNLSSYMKYRFDNMIQYNKDHQMWSKLNQLDEIKIETQEELKID